MSFLSFSMRIPSRRPRFSPFCKCSPCLRRVLLQAVLLQAVPLELGGTRKAMVLRREALAVLLLLCAASCAWACIESDAGVQCDAGAQCGICLLLVNASACSSMSFHGNTKCWVVKRGEMCEGDGECGTDDNANNCAAQEGREPLKDVYLRVPCRGEGAALGEEPGAEAGEDLRLLLLVASFLCGWMLCGAWRKARAPSGRPDASLAGTDGAGEVQLEAMARVPVARSVLVPLAEVQVARAPAVSRVEGQGEEAAEAEARAAPCCAGLEPEQEPERTESRPPALSPPTPSPPTPAEAAAARTEADGATAAAQHAVEQRSV